MSDKTKTFSDWEKEKGAFANDTKKYPGNKKMTESEFMDAFLGNQTEFTGVNYEDRVKFLEDNGYKVTRDNLLNPELSSKPPKKSK